MAKFKRTGDLELLMATLPGQYKAIFKEDVSRELIQEIIKSNIDDMKLKWLETRLTDSSIDFLEYLEMLKLAGDKI